MFLQKLSGEEKVPPFDRGKSGLIRQKFDCWVLNSTISHKLENKRQMNQLPYYGGIYSAKLDPQLRISRFWPTSYSWNRENPILKNEKSRGVCPNARCVPPYCIGETGRQLKIRIKKNSDAQKKHWTVIMLFIFWTPATLSKRLRSPYCTKKIGSRTVSNI